MRADARLNANQVCCLRRGSGKGVGQCVDGNNERARGEQRTGAGEETERERGAERGGPIPVWRGRSKHARARSRESVLLRLNDTTRGSGCSGRGVGGAVRCANGERGRTRGRETARE